MADEQAWPCFDDAKMMLMTIVSVLLMRTDVNFVKDESMEGTKVVIKVTTQVAAPNTILCDVISSYLASSKALLIRYRETSR